MAIRSTKLDGMRVSVYRNLRYGKKSPPLYSIVHKGRVIARRHRVLISNATFIVREGGRQRVYPIPGASIPKCVAAENR